MINEDSFCAKCGQKINRSRLAGFLGGDKIIELDDGVYCFTCGKLEVERRRRKK